VKNVENSKINFGSPLQPIRVSFKIFPGTLYIYLYIFIYMYICMCMCVNLILVHHYYAFNIINIRINFFSFSCSCRSSSKRSTFIWKSNLYVFLNVISYIYAYIYIQTYSYTHILTILLSFVLAVRAVALVNGQPSYGRITYICFVICMCMFMHKYTHM
jgi:membrane-associated HD superfamily phosphohydrolase